MTDERVFSLLQARVVELETEITDLSERLEALGTLNDRIVQTLKAVHGDDPHLALIEDAAVRALRPRSGWPVKAEPR
jgi:hypothetical protein